MKTRNLSVNQVNGGYLTLVGPTRDNPVLDPLAVLDLDNRLCTSRMKNMPTHKNPVQMISFIKVHYHQKKIIQDFMFVREFFW